MDDMFMIRGAEPKDYEKILEILNHAIALRSVTALLTPVTMEKRKQWFKDHEDGIHRIFVATTEKNEVVGWMAINAYRNGREGFDGACEVSYYVEPTCQQKGVASRLMEHVIESGRQTGLTHLMLIIFSTNQPSLRLAHRFGFRIWGTFPEIVNIDGKVMDCYQLGLRL